MIGDLIGHHGVYRKLAAGLSLYAIGSVYGLFAYVQVAWRGQTWVLEPLPLAAVAALIVVFAVIAYAIFLLLDGHLTAAGRSEVDAV